MGNAIPVNATHTGRCTRALHLTMGKKAIKPRGALHMSETVSGRHHVAYPLRYTVPDMRHATGTPRSWIPSQQWAVNHRSTRNLLANPFCLDLPGVVDLATRAIRGEKVAPSEAERVVQAHLRAPFAYNALKDKVRGAAERIVRDYIVDNAPLFDHIEFSEKAIELSLGDGISVVGRIDLVRRTDTDETTIIDLKSNQRAQADDLADAQLHMYALGYLELTGKRADYASTYHLEMVTGQVKTAAKALRKLELPPKPVERTQRRCDHRKLCPCGAA